jgi:hypothetical protein
MPSSGQALRTKFCDKWSRPRGRIIPMPGVRRLKGHRGTPAAFLGLVPTRLGRLALAPTLVLFPRFMR